jgi:hypothetical protein
MSTLRLILKPTSDGWAVYVIDGHKLAHFSGPGAEERAPSSYGQRSCGASRGGDVHLVGGPRTIETLRVAPWRLSTA